MMYFVEFCYQSGVFQIRSLHEAISQNVNHWAVGSEIRFAPIAFFETRDECSKFVNMVLKRKKNPARGDIEL